MSPPLHSSHDLRGANEHTWLAANDELWTGPRTELRLWHPAPGVIAHRVRGHLPSDFVPHIIQTGERALAIYPTPVSFADWEGMVSYDREARVRLTTWVRNTMPRLGPMTLLVRSKVVAMGVSLANLALGNFLQVMTSREGFDAAMAQAAANALQGTRRASGVIRATR